MAKLEYNCNNIIYNPPKQINHMYINKSISVIGIDTESFINGNMIFMATSLGDHFEPDEIPYCFFTNKYINKHYVDYNLKYEESAFIKLLPINNRKELQSTGKTKYLEFTYLVIDNKSLTIRYKRNCIHIWDIAGFFGTSLNQACKTFLNKEKMEVEHYEFTPEYVSKHYFYILEYCIYDCILVQELGTYLIKKFESFGIYPRKLYSTAYISYQYFYKNCHVPPIKRFWNYYKPILDYAMQSYNGGKFEVTTKGIDYYYEYDINSAYPYEIANLVDISKAEIIESNRYNNKAYYGFIDCEFEIPFDLYHPIAIKSKELNIYPCGTIRKVITKNEYDFLQYYNVKIKIYKAYWFIIEEKIYPFKSEIEKLYRMKSELKNTSNTIEYHLIKIFLNSFYGKFCQLIKQDDKYKAGSSWNPIYASIITANVRIRVSNMQNKYPNIHAVATDSVISNTPIPLNCSSKLGDWDKATEGNGIIIGNGIYQIGKKVRVRGFESKINLYKYLYYHQDTITIPAIRPLGWREVTFHGWDEELINQFIDVSKKIHINFDNKRIWINDWNTFDEIRLRKIESIPRKYDNKLGLLLS